MLKILLFSPKGSGTHYYGPGMSAYRMYENIRNMENISLSLAHGYKEQERFDLFNQQYFISDIDNKSFISGLEFLIKSRSWIKKNSSDFDVLHSLSSFQHSFIFSKWFENAGTPSVIKVTGSTGFTESSFKSKILGLRNYRKTYANDISSYISISSRISKLLLESGISNEKIHYIPNGVDTLRFQPIGDHAKNVLKEKYQLPNKKTIIFSGAFRHEKNPFLVVKAFHAAKYNKDAQLILAGPDGDNGVLRKKISEFIQLNNINNIVLKNFTSDVEELYQMADFFIQPSNQEGLSNSLLEAQACGLPAIVTRVSGAEDVVKESVNGVFVSFDVDDISSAIDFYIQNDEHLKNHSLAARALMEKEYRSEVILNKHIDLFIRLKNKAI